ncbi:MAG: DUF1302 domain-containing protein [Candidatus Magnetomorum sp.]|nr:DUF1302 domain-containing protein [Candidatus Magnetomorum sp.]
MIKKCNRLCGITLLTVLGIMGGASNVFAVSFAFGDIEGNLDSTFSVGASFRVENRDYNLIGKANQPEFVNDPNEYLDGDRRYKETFGSGQVQSGLWSNNGDDGDLNFDTGLISELVKVTTDFSIKYMDFGFFARGMAFYDAYLMSESDDMRVDIMDNEDSKDLIGRGLDLLDAFVYYNSYIKDTPFSVRIGRQVINWGESSYIPHGISESNPIDVGKLRSPGAELKEAFLPVGSIWTSIGLSETINFESFYQYEFTRMIPDAPGSYFSTNDFIGDGGNWIQSSFHMPDLHPNFDDPNYKGIYASAPMIDVNGQSIIDIITSADVTLFPYQFNHVVERLENAEASNNGQYGFKCSWFAEQLNNTEFGFYFVNYHSRRPVLSGFVHDGVSEDALDEGLRAKGVPEAMISNFDLGDKVLLAGGKTSAEVAQINLLPQAQKDAIKAGAIGTTFFSPGDIYGRDSDFAGHTRDGWIHGYAEYPEDIKLFGLSFNTVLPNGMSVAGEYSYRKDEPLQVDDVEMIMALSTPLYSLLYSKGVQPIASLPLNPEDGSHPYFSQIEEANGPGKSIPGDYICGYRRLDVSQAQVSFTQLFSDVMGASKMSALAEFGYVYIHDMPDQDVLRFDALGTVRSGNITHAGMFGVDGYFSPIYNLQGYAPEGVEENDFASAFSWGYRLMVQLDYSNVFAGINVSPKFTFSHDVYGSTPVPIATFLKHRKDASLNINFDYQRKWSLDIGGRMFWGAGNANRMADRDYVWMTVKYAI